MQSKLKSRLAVLEKAMRRFAGAGGAKHNVISNCASYRKVFSYSHETTLDIRCHIRPEFAAGNPTFRGVALRSPPARCLARGAGTDLPGGRRVARPRSAFGRVLGSSLPTTRIGRIDRRRSARTPEPVER